MGEVNRKLIQSFLEKFDKATAEENDGWLACVIHVKGGTVTIERPTTSTFPYSAFLAAGKLFLEQLHEIDQQKDKPNGKPEPLPLAEHLRGKIPEGYKVVETPAYLKDTEITDQVREEQNEKNACEPTGLGFEEETQDKLPVVEEVEIASLPIRETIEEPPEGIDGDTPQVGTPGAIPER